MSKAIKTGIYRACRRLGLFALARRVTERRLRILCYHGLSVTDEHVYSPGLFMRVETFRSRLETLLRLGYTVLPLEQALRRLTDGTLPPNTTVVTIDDGFYGIYLHGADVLRQCRLPMTLYVTTYYVVKQTPIFRHAVQYLFWKSRAAALDLQGLPGTSEGLLDLNDAVRVHRVQWDLIERCEALLSEPEKVQLCHVLSQRLGVSYEELVRSRGLSLLTVDEIRQLAELGMDIQLHTHRHHLPDASDQLRREIEDNRGVLEPLVGHSCCHLCYPSGVYDRDQWPCLERLGIQSATTCENGFNDAATPRYALKRFLDAEDVQPIEFEAELCGFAELLRSLRALLRKDDQRTGVANPRAHGR